MVSYQNHRAYMGTNPNFDTNAPPFEIMGAKLFQGWESKINVSIYLVCDYVTSGKHTLCTSRKYFSNSLKKDSKAYASSLLLVYKI